MGPGDPMKRVLAAAMILLGGSQVAAQELSKPTLLIHGGLAIPTTPAGFSNGASLGFGGGVGLGVRMADPIMLIMDFDFTNYGLDADGFRNTNNLPPNTSLAGGETSTFYLAAVLKISVPSLPSRLVRPYLIGGLGFFRFVADDVVVDGRVWDRDAQNAVGIHGGAGVDFWFVEPLGFFFETVFVLGFADNDLIGYLPFRVGLALAMGAGS